MEVITGCGCSDYHFRIFFELMATFGPRNV
jgi:hypothetical protein